MEKRNKLQVFSLSSELQDAYERLTGDDIRSDGSVVNSAMVKSIVREMVVKTVDNVLKNPQSVKADVSLDVAKGMLKKYEYQGDYHSVYLTMLYFLVDALYEQKANQECLNRLTERIEKECQKHPAKNLKESILLYNCAVKSGRESLFQNNADKGSKFVTIDADTFGLFEQGIDYEPFFEVFKNSGVTQIEIEDLPSDVDEKLLKGLLSGHRDLKKIVANKRESALKHQDVSADVLTGNASLEEMDFSSFNLKKAGKLLKECPKLKRLILKTEPGYFGQALKAHKPADLEYVDYNEQNATRRINLMKQYPDLIIERTAWDRMHEDDSLYIRNEDIIEAKKTRSAWDIKSVILDGGLIEYLELMAPEDRPTFETLNRRTGRTQVDYSKTSCFNVITRRKDFKKLYAKVYELCDFSDCEKAANLYKAIQCEELVDYLKLLPVQERPSLEFFFEAVTPGEPSFLDAVYDVYDTRGENIMAKVLDLCPYSKEGLDILTKDLRFENVVKKYEKAKRQNTASSQTAARLETTTSPKVAVRKQNTASSQAKKNMDEKTYHQNMADIQSAFEKWKEEHQRGV